MRSHLRREIEHYLRMVGDLDLPYELFTLIYDGPRLRAYGTAIVSSLQHKPGARVVCHGPGALLWSMSAAKCGATVVVAEPGSYFAPLIQEVVRDNGFQGQIEVIQGGLRELPASWHRQTDLVVLDGIDSALLGQGLLENARWAREQLLTSEGQLIPRAGQLFSAPGELLLGPQCGFDLHPVDRHRGVAPSEPVALHSQGFRQLATAQRSLAMDFASGEEELTPRLDFHVETAGRFNALASWYALELDETTRLGNNPRLRGKDAQAVSFGSEATPVEVGELLRFHTSLNAATGLAFRAEGPQQLRGYGRLRPTLPAWHFPMLADARRNEAFVGAIERALERRTHAQVLDIGAGSGLLALAAARAGAQGVTACEMVPHIAELARTCVAVNDYEQRITIAARSSLELVVPDEMAQRASLLVSETVDHGLLGERFLVALAHAREELLTANAEIIPSGATLYLTPIDLHVGEIEGFDLRAIDQLRLGHYTGLYLAETPHTLLAEPLAVYHFDFQSGEAKPTQKRFEAQITTAGVCTGVALWFDLQLDAEATLCTAPGAGSLAWQQGIILFDQTLEVSIGDVLPIWCNHDLERVTVYPDPAHLAEMPHRLWPRRRALWALQHRAESENRTVAHESLTRLMRLAEPAKLEQVWNELMGDDPALSWLRRDKLADLFAQLGHEL